MRFRRSSDTAPRARGSSSIDGRLVRLLREQAVDLQEGFARRRAGHRGSASSLVEPRLELVVRRRLDRVATAVPAASAATTCFGRSAAGSSVAQSFAASCASAALPRRERDLGRAPRDARVLRLARGLEVRARRERGLAALQARRRRAAADRTGRRDSPAGRRVAERRLRRGRVDAPGRTSPGLRPPRCARAAARTRGRDDEGESWVRRMNVVRATRDSGHGACATTLQRR